MDYPHLKKRLWGQNLWACFYATVGQITEEMIKQYVAHHFELSQDDNFRMEPTKWDAS